MENYLMIGQVLKPQGIRGEAKIKPYAANTDAFHQWKTLYIQDKSGAYTPIASKCTRIHDGFVYLLLADCACPEDVEKLRDTKLYIDRANAAPLEDGAVYIADLIGCKAVDGDGVTVGVLEDVLQHGSVDVYVFKTATGHLMAPALRDVFPTVDVAMKRMGVNRARLEEVMVEY